jgi:hypothetical protein
MDRLADIAGDLQYNFIPQNSYQVDMKFCCERNQLLQKYRHDPDVMEYIRHCAKKEKHEVPSDAKAVRHVPSLKFFAAKKAFQEDFEAFHKDYPEGLEQVRDLLGAMGDTFKKLTPERGLIGCPWSCSIL